MQKIVLYIFGALIAFVALLLVVSSFPIQGNYQIMIVQSGSMEPAIRTGSIILIKPVSEYAVGDVITFGSIPRGKVPTTHRIVEMRAQSGAMVYQTKGDANEESDEREVREREVIGKVFLDIPFVGYILAAAKKPIGFAVLIIVPSLIILFDEGKKVWIEIARIRKSKQASGTKGEEIPHKDS